MIFLKKFFFIFSFILFFITTSAYAEKINKLIVNGNERITPETIAVFGDIILGKDYNSSDVSKLIKKLYETDFFSNVSVQITNGILTLTVKENPIINIIELEGEPTKKYTEALKELFVLREKSAFIKNYVKSDIKIIKNFYRNLGFYFVKIDMDVENLNKNRVNLNYNINKGKKAKISKIYFLGDKKIREKTLRDIITSQENKFWKFISRNIYLNQGRIELDKRLLKNYYKNNGYYEVDISTSNVEYSEGEGFVLTYTINAGKRYRFSKIYANVSEKLDKQAFISLEDKFNSVIGDYYSRKKLTNILEEVDTLSQLKELQFINHDVTESLVGNGVEVRINIFEGKKFIIERINVVGNSVTNDSVIRSELAVDEGDPFSAILVNRSINQLKARNIFGTVDHSIKEGSSPKLKILEISIEERPTGEITAGAGIGTRGTSFMFAVSENNWLGKGVRLTSSINLSPQTLSGRISLSDPNFNYSGNRVTSSINVASSDMTKNSGYKSSKSGMSVGTEFEQYRDVYIAPSISASREKIDVESSASSAIKKNDGTFNNLDFKYAVAWDKRNQKYKPTDGYISRFTQTLPILQESAALVNGFDASIYHSPSENVIGVGKFYARAIHGVDGDVRLTSRLFMPQNKLRGFDTMKVGPLDGSDYVGGNYIAAIGLEAQLPNLLPESTNTDFSFFIDAGNVWSVDYNSTINDTNEIRSSAGIAANVYTAIGPLSFTLAQAISKAQNDKTEIFNFRLGTSF